MSIEYVLFESKLANIQTGAHAARVRPTFTADLDAIAEVIVQRGTTVAKADILSVLEDFFTVVEQFVQQGANVNTPHVNYRVSIRGLFDGPTDGYDPTRHQVVARLNPGPRLRKFAREHLVVEKLDPGAELAPLLLRYTDRNSGTLNSILTPNGLGEIEGRRLQFDRDDPDQGVYFVGADGTATPAAIVGRNMPSELSFLVPDLAPGVYTLQVKAISRRGTELRTGKLKAPLTVA
jgi:hypothetical protein